jgi:hypothetical protein
MQDIEITNIRSIIGVFSEKDTKIPFLVGLRLSFPYRATVESGSIDIYSRYCFSGNPISSHFTKVCLWCLKYKVNTVVYRIDSDKIT